MAVPVRVQSGTAAFLGTQGESSFDVPYPTSTAITAGNKLILVVGQWSNTVTLSIPTPSGWALISSDLLDNTGDAGGTTDDFILYAFWKDAAGGETGNVTLSITDGGTGSPIGGIISEYSGVASGSDFWENTHGTPFQSGTGATLSMPGVTTSDVDRLAVAYAYLKDDAQTAAATGETGGDWGDHVGTFTTLGGDSAIMVQHAAMASAGTISGGTVGTSRNSWWAIRGIALKPPSEAATEEERLAPDTVVAGGSNLEDTLSNSPPTRLADIDEDTDSDDTEWWTAVDATAATDVTLGFPTPTGTLSGTQTVNALLRKTTGAPTPTIDMILLEAGTPVRTLLNDTAITSTSGQVVTGTFEPNEITDPADVQIRIVSTPGSA